MKHNYQTRRVGLFTKSSENLSSTGNYGSSGLDRSDFPLPPQKSQKLTVGEIFLFVLQVAALVVLFMYIYRTPSNSATSERELKGSTTFQETSTISNS